jgi:lipoprotein-releasing system permease protein
MVIISMTSIALACGALALTWSIMRGFEEVTLKNLQTIHPQLIMESRTGASLNFPAIQQVLKQEFPEISASAPKITRQVIIATQEQQLSPAITIMGIDPELEYLVTNLNSQIIKPDSTNHTDILNNNLKILDLITNNIPDQILIGAELAKNYNLNIGDQIELLIPNQTNNLTRSIQFASHDATVGAIFKTGVSDFDQNLIICNLDFLKIIFPYSQVTQVSLKLDSQKLPVQYHLAQTINFFKKIIKNTPESTLDPQNLTLFKKLKSRFKLDIYPWQELYTPIIAALRLEKYVMGLILLLITIITSFTIIALMFMLVTQRTHEIALLQTLGLNQTKIRQLFSLISLTIVTIATTIGLAVAYLLGYLLNKYPIITLPEVYLINTLPIKLEFTVFLTIFGLSLILGLIATWLPIKQVKYLQIAAILKQRL